MRGINLEKVKLDNVKLGWCNLFRVRIVDLLMVEYDYIIINFNGYWWLKKVLVIRLILVKNKIFIFYRVRIF